MSDHQTQIDPMLVIQESGAILAGQIASLAADLAVANTQVRAERAKNEELHREIAELRAAQAPEKRPVPKNPPAK